MLFVCKINQIKNQFIVNRNFILILFTFLSFICYGNVDSSKDGYETEQRIDRYRKADLTLQFDNYKGDLYSVSIELIKHQFRFCGVIAAENFYGEGSEKRRDIFLKTFNMAGFENALKAKEGFKQRLAPIAKDHIFPWLQDNGIEVRGHTLAWPGVKHMRKDMAYALTNGKSQIALKMQNDHIMDYIKRYDVVEWDLLNEPRANHDMQDSLGYNIVPDWFKLATEYSKSIGRDQKFYLNDYQVVSAWSDKAAAENIKSYIETANLIKESGAELGGAGVQARVKIPLDKLSPEQVYKRLDRVATIGVPIMATEFEVVSIPKHKFSEKERADITEKMVTTYFSHPSVIGVGFWTLFSDNKPQALFKLDGTIKPNGKVLMDLINKKWHSSKISKISEDGTVNLRGFKGDYKIVIRNGDKVVKELTIKLKEDSSFKITI